MTPDDYEWARLGLRPNDPTVPPARHEHAAQNDAMRDALKRPIDFRALSLGQRPEVSTPVARAPSTSATPRAAAPRQAAPTSPALAAAPSGCHADAMRPMQRAVGSRPVSGDVVPFRKAEPSKPVQQPARPVRPPPMRPAATGLGALLKAEIARRDDVLAKRAPRDHYVVRGGAR